MKCSLAVATVFSLSLITIAAGQTGTDAAEESPPARAAELPDLPPAPPESATTEPAADPGNPDARIESADEPQQSEPQQPPTADQDPPIGIESDGDNWFGARFITDADGRFVVQSVTVARPAAQTGLRADDVILAVDGQTFDTEPDLRMYLREHSGDRLPITILRDGSEQTVFLQSDGGNDAPTSRPALGVRFLRGPALRIIDVVDGSPADHAGVVPGDFIVSMNGEQFASTDAFLGAVAHADVNANVELVLNRHGEIIVAHPRLDSWEAVFDHAGTTVTALRPDLEADDVVTPHVHSPACATGHPYYWTGYRYPWWPYWTSAYVGPYFYAPYSGPIYYGPAYTYWPVHATWRYPIYSAYVW